jgi:hypothetical protein
MMPHSVRLVYCLHSSNGSFMMHVHVAPTCLLLMAVSLPGAVRLRSYQEVQDPGAMTTPRTT